MVTTKIDVREVGNADVLGGRILGQRTRPRFEAVLSTASPGTLAVFDFRRVKLVTASYFLAALGWIWTSEEFYDAEVFPALENLTPDSQDEILLALRDSGLRAVLVETNGDEVERQSYLNIEPSENEILQTIEQAGEVTAADLFRKDPGVQPTAWSNRLALLHSYRLLRRRKEGRQLVYSVTWR